MKNKILVLMAAYNGENYIFDQILSIQNQLVKPLCLLINVDYSADDTVKIISNLRKRYSNIHIFNSNLTFNSAAQNFFYLLKNAQLKNFDYIALSDQDDLWRSNKLQKAIQILEKGYDGYSSNIEAFWEDGRKKVLVKNQPQKKFDHFFESAGPGCTFVLNKKLALKLQQFLKNGHFNQLDNYHDWLIYAFARAHSFKWHIDSFPSVEYRQHSTNLFGANVGIKAFASRAYRVLSGEGIDFSFQLMKELDVQDSFIQSLFPVSRFNLLRLAIRTKCCRRRFRDQIYFFFACILLAIIFPKKLRTI